MFRKNSLKRSIKLLVVLGILALTASVAFAQDRPWTTQGERGNYSERPMPAQISGAKLDTPAQMQVENLSDLRVNPELRGQAGRVQVVVRLAGAAATNGSTLQAAVSQQGAFVSAARAVDSRAKVLGSTQVVMNAVMLEVDASALSALAQNPDVVSINPVRNYELDLSETVPYIGATAVQAAGFDGTGVRVAVIDSGIDYTHIAFGGSGDPNDWLNNDPTIIEPGTFPTARFVGGYDFVGSEWPNGPEMPDPDPIDDGPGGGHGTHVADIIGGAMGVAPGVDLYALKVCSSVSSSCAGVPLIQAMEFAVDPNGDGNPDDAVDVINMSLGSSYGDPRWDDLSYAVNNASALGVLTVASAGNSADKPYANGTPSSASTALAVAQTNVPSANQPLMEVTAPASIAGLYAAVFQPWAVEPTARIEGPLQYGDGAGGNLNGCTSFAPGTLTGKIVLVDRGTCGFSLKISNIADGGALVGIIGLIAPGDPFQGGFGEGDPSIPGYMISQADSNALKSGLAEGVTVVFDPANGISLVQHLVGSSSRGPTVGTNEAGPDIGAPGASVSAVWGSGTGTEAFGGTSGAAPMVTGSAALLMSAYPDRTWSEIKAVLMNTGETDMMNNPAFFGGYQAAISRIGGGEVRVFDALNSTVAAWDRNALDATLSFGFHDIVGNQTMVKRVTVRNYSNQPVTLRSNVAYRYDNDNTGVVRLSVPSFVTVPRNGSVTFPVHMHIRPRTNQPLHDWVLNSDSNGANPDALTLNEYDGYINFEGDGGSTASIHMPWHVLPRGAGNIQSGVRQNGLNWVRNTGVAASYIDTYSLIGMSDRQPDAPVLGGNAAPADLRYVGVQTYPVPAGFCGAESSFVMSFAVNTWDRYSHAAANIWIEADVDVDGDGLADYAIFNFDNSGGFSSAPSDGRAVTWVYDLSTGSADAWFYATHETNSGNVVLTFCGDQIGLNANDFFTTSMGVDVFANDWYYGGGEDAITGLNVVPLGERYYTIFGNGDAGLTELPARSGALPFGVIDFGDQMNATENGLLWIYGPGAPADNEAQAWIIN